MKRRSEECEDSLGFDSERFFDTKLRGKGMEVKFLLSGMLKEVEKGYTRAITGRNCNICRIVVPITQSAQSVRERFGVDDDASRSRLLFLGTRIRISISLSLYYHYENERHRGFRLAF